MRHLDEMIAETCVDFDRFSTPTMNSSSCFHESASVKSIFQRSVDKHGPNAEAVSNEAEVRQSQIVHNEKASLRRKESEVNLMDRINENPSESESPEFISHLYSDQKNEKRNPIKLDRVHRARQVTTDLREESAETQSETSIGSPNSEKNFVSFDRNDAWSSVLEWEDNSLSPKKRNYEECERRRPILVRPTPVKPHPDVCSRPPLCPHRFPALDCSRNGDFTPFEGMLQTSRSTRFRLSPRYPGSQHDKDRRFLPYDTIFSEVDCYVVQNGSPSQCDKPAFTGSQFYHKDSEDAYRNREKKCTAYVEDDFCQDDGLHETQHESETRKPYIMENEELDDVIYSLCGDRRMDGYAAHEQGDSPINVHSYGRRNRGMAPVEFCSESPIQKSIHGINKSKDKLDVSLENDSMLSNTKRVCGGSYFSESRKKRRTTLNSDTELPRGRKAAAAKAAAMAGADMTSFKNAIESFRGVTFRPSGKWQAQCYFQGRSRYIGVFDSRQKASLAFEVARDKLMEGNDDNSENSSALSETIDNEDAKKEALSKRLGEARKAAQDAVKAVSRDNECEKRKESS